MHYGRLLYTRQITSGRPAILYRIEILQWSHPVNNRHIILSTLLLFILSLHTSLSNAKERIVAWTYYDFPPFIISEADKKGLSYDFVSLLNQHEEFGYRFKLKYLPRKRLNKLLGEGRKGIVLWVNPIFFEDTSKTKYLWTTSLLSDQQDLISLKSKPVIYDGTPKSLKGYTIGGVLGHRYKGLEEAIQNGLLTRKNVNREKQNIGKLLAKRIDVFLIPNTSMAYYDKEMKLTNKIYYSPIPLNKYNRHIMVQKEMTEVHKALNTIIKDLPNNGFWEALGEQYGLEDNFIR